MDKRAALYQQFDPARPLEADSDLYVDWQRDLNPDDDIKQRLANSVSLAGDIAVSRLLTGHRGVGKTTELKRVKRILEGDPGAGAFSIGRKYFVSLLEAEQWLDLQDVAPPDIIFHIVRQLVDDLNRAGFGFAATSFGEFFKEFRDILTSQVELRNIDIPTDIAKFGLVLKQVPVARGTLRSLLQGHLPKIYDLINDVILKKARQWLKQEKGCDDILVIVDELDRIPQKVITEQGLTNHVNIFLDGAGTLRSLNCNVLYTVPIELAYSSSRERLKAAYATEILALPVIPVTRRDDSPFEDGLQTMSRIVEERTAKAGATMEEFFSDRELPRRLCALSGGHVRMLFILIRSAIERCNELPITPEVVDLTVKRGAIDISLAIDANRWQALDEVHRTKKPVEDDPELWYGLLKDLFVYGYEDELGVWYDWNPLLGEIPAAGRPSPKT